MNKTKESESLKKKILKLVGDYVETYHRDFLPAGHVDKPEWHQGDPVAYAGRIYDKNEVVASADALLDFWLTFGDNASSFEIELSSYLGTSSTILTNSGSSANLLAISALTSHYLPENKRITPGDEVITVAAGFPTTAYPINQNGAVPVFIDANYTTGNPNTKFLEKAYKPGKTKAVIFAHALGNPFNLIDVLEFCKRYDLWLVEDNCDSLGSIYSMPVEKALQFGFEESSPGLSDDKSLISRYTGSWGDLSTQSFYPPHHLTMGEGGAVNIVKNKKLRKIVESFRDWGRDCWCPSGKDNTCNMRFEWKLGSLPEGYDHKYIYTHLGYNLKPLDVQAAIGREQLKKIHTFTSLRQQNWLYMREVFDKFSEYFDFTLPTHAVSWDDSQGFKWDNSGCRTSCSWFGFKIGVKPTAHFSRRELIQYLDQFNIATRMLFGGNLTRQPVYSQGFNSLRIVEPLNESDQIMNDVFFLGTYPGITKEMIDYQAELIAQFISSSK